MKVTLFASKKGIGIKLLVLLSALALSGPTYGAAGYSAENANQAQGQWSVSGSVRDINGDPLVGVSVTIAGTMRGTITDAGGLYTLNNVSDRGSTLVFASLGYIRQEVAIEGRSVVDVVMEADVYAMSEVVVIGYGTMRKSDVTGSIATVRGSDLSKNKNFSVLDDLRGKAAGVSIFSNGGQTGMYAPRVIIRGSSSINASTDPLYVVDGVVMNDFYLMNPSDIESIEVLKDASSTAIYGARGGGGVVMVTTKRGVKGGGLAVSYDGSLSVSSPQRFMPVMNATEWVEAFRIGLENAKKWQGYTGSTDPKSFLNNPDYFRSDGSPIYNTDWQREATRTTVSHSHQLNIQYGREKSSIGAFLGYSDHQGIMNNTFDKRLSARMAWDAQPLKWLSTSVNLSVNHVYSRITPEQGGGQDARRTMIEMVPWLPVSDKEGNYTTSSTGGVDQILGLEGMANPVFILDKQKRMRYNTAVKGNATLTFHLLKGLDLVQQLGISNTFMNEKYHSSKLLSNISAPDGEAWRDYSNDFYWEEKVYLTYKRTFGDHGINAMVGTEWSRWTYDQARMRVRGLADAWEWNNMGLGTNQRPNSSDWDRESRHSVFARAAYSYKNRYSATVTARVDGSSKFGANNKYAFFPSGGLAWNISNEGFMAGNRTIDNLRLHTSIGVTGNSDIPSFQSLSRMSYGTGLLDGSRQTTARAASMPNPDLKWEKNTMWDIGVELGMLGHRLNFDVSFYIKNTTDLLLEAPIPRTTGFPSILMNVGAVRNTGLDVMISGIPVQTTDWRWQSTLNFNYNKNKVVKLANNNADIEERWWVGGSNAIIRVGENMNSFYGYTREGVVTEEDAAANPAEYAGKVGRAKRSATKSILGKGVPDVVGSFTNTLSYRNFDLSVDFQFVLGVQTMQQFYHSTYDRFGITNGLKDILYDAYNGSNPGTMQQAIYLTGSAGGVGQDTLVDSSWVVDGSYLRLNQVMLGYNFSSEICRKLHLSSLRLYLSGGNLFLVTSKKFKGYDPESSSQIDENGSRVSYNKFGQNIAFFSYPRARTFMAGLQVTF